MTSYGIQDQNNESHVLFIYFQECHLDSTVDEELFNGDGIILPCHGGPCGWVSEMTCWGSCGWHVACALIHLLSIIMGPIRSMGGAHTPHLLIGARCELFIV